MLRPWSSKVPDIIDALVARLKVVTDNTGVVIRDGPWIEGGTDPQVIIIGMTGFVSAYQFPRTSQDEVFGNAAITAVGAADGLGAGIRETITVNCASLVRVGDTKLISEARRQAYANVAVVGQVLLEPPLWINGLAMRAIIGATTALDFAQDRRGLLTNLVFTIECEAQAQQ